MDLNSLLNSELFTKKYSLIVGNITVAIADRPDKSSTTISGDDILSYIKIFFFTLKMNSSTTWFGIITNENNMSSIYRRLLDFKNASYRIIGKLRNNEDDIILIKFLLVFDTEVNFEEITDNKYSDVFNTIIPIEPSKTKDFIDMIQKITSIQSGYNPVDKLFVEDERYYSSEDSAYTDSEEEEEEEDDEYDEEYEDEDKEIAQMIIKHTRETCYYHKSLKLLCTMMVSGLFVAYYYSEITQFVNDHMIKEKLGL